MLSKLRYKRLISELPNEGRHIVNGFRNDDINYPEAKDALLALQLNGVLTMPVYKRGLRLLELLIDEKAGE